MELYKAIIVIQMCIIVSIVMAMVFLSLAKIKGREKERLEGEKRKEMEVLENIESYCRALVERES